MQTMIDIKPINDKVFIGIYDDGSTISTLGGKEFFSIDDSMVHRSHMSTDTHTGIRPRWGVVLAFSDKVEQLGGLTLGCKVYLDQMKWTHSTSVSVQGKNIKVWTIPFDDVLLAGVDEPFNEHEMTKIKKLYPDWDHWMQKV